MNEAELRETLEQYRSRNPDTTFADVMIHELKQGSTVGTPRMPNDFVDA